MQNGDNCINTLILIFLSMMPLQKDILFDSGFEKTNSFFYTCNDNYILFDNFDNKQSKFPVKKKFFNSSFYHAFLVEKGSLKVIIDGVEIHVRQNEYLNVRPCTTVTFLKSYARVFAIIIRAHVVLNVYQKINVTEKIRNGLFCFYHHKFSKELFNEFKNLYLLMRDEAVRPESTLKELVFNEYTKIYIINVIANLKQFPEIEHYENNSKRKVYIKFQNLLQENYDKERNVVFYADKLGISSKYLSNITKFYTGYPASAVIDNYVAFRIKVMLYDGELSIKKISEIFNFKSQSFFGRYFKRMTGLSPREFVENFNKRLFRTTEDVQ